MEVSQEDIFWKKVSGVGIDFNKLPNHFLFVKLANDENRIKKIELGFGGMKLLIEPFYIRQVNDNPLSAVIHYSSSDKYIACSIDVAGDKYYKLLFPTTPENLLEYDSLINLLNEIKYDT